jgi:hypothetical protein
MNSSNLAIVPYRLPLTAMEFIRSEVVRGVESGMIPDEQLKLREGKHPYDLFIAAHGTFGYGNFKKMDESLSKYSLEIRYSSITRKFTILDSSNIDKSKIQSIFAENIYELWLPEVLDMVDRSGNRLVCLKSDMPLSVPIRDLHWLMVSKTSDRESMEESFSNYISDCEEKFVELGYMLSKFLDLKV